PAERLADYEAYIREKTHSAVIMDDSEARAFLSWDEARELAGMGFEIGSHTAEHPILSQISRERVAAELRESKATLERELGRSCCSIAYPNGLPPDVNATVFEEVSAAGYDWAFTTVPAWHRSNEDRHNIRRVLFPGHTDLATFKTFA